MDDALATAKNCRHYAMCKVDFLGSGVCASGLDKQYVSYFPVGRMDLYAALVENTVPVTERCVEIADGCDLCGRCDYQCYFVNEMRPSKVMRALKERVGAHLQSGTHVVKTEADGLLSQLRAIVGEEWATNDPAIRITYHHDLCPHVDFKMPRYVVMPNSKEETRSIVNLLREENVPYVVRSSRRNGASSHGLVFSEGAILDLNRIRRDGMKLHADGYADGERFVLGRRLVEREHVGRRHVVEPERGAVPSHEHALPAAASQSTWPLEKRPALRRPSDDLPDLLD